MPEIFKSLILSRTGVRMTFMGGLTGPCHTPVRMIFSAFIRIPGGKLVTVSKTGQNACFDDLKS